MKKNEDGKKDIASNRRAYHDYAIDDKYEAGICLTGSEVKSCRNHSVSFTDAYADIKGGEVFLNNLNISPYKQAGRFNHDPVRGRKLLLKRNEILKLTQKLNQKGYTLIPLRMYLSGHLIKVELGLGKGKREYEKRDDIKAREAQKEIDRAVNRSLKQWQ
jgi:SsrA-binding protein